MQTEKFLAQQPSPRLVELRAEERQKQLMRILLVVAAIVGFSGYALAQTPTPKSGKALKQAKPSAPMGCKLVGTVKGAKIWAGDCASAPGLQGTPPTAEPAAPSPPPEANPPADKP